MIFGLRIFKCIACENDILSWPSKDAKRARKDLCLKCQKAVHRLEVKGVVKFVS